MIWLTALDPLFRGGTIALLLLWSIILWRDHRPVPAARVAIAMNLSIIAFVLNGALVAIDPLSAATLVCDVTSVLSPALFWLFARLWFDDRARVGARSWGLIATFGLLPVVQIALIIVTGHASLMIWTLVRIGMVGFGIAGIWIAWRGRHNDLVEVRRGFRLALAWAIGGFGLIVNAQEIMIRAGHWPHGGRSLTDIAILIVTLAASVGLYRIRSADLFAAPRVTDEPMAPPPLPIESPLIARLRSVMEHDRAYRSEGFGIAALAAQLSEPEYRLRRAINGELGFRNFTAFLNSYRLAEVKAALVDPTQRDVPILTIAIDAGFGSLGPFNRAFRDAEGMTPSEFRRGALEGDVQLFSGRL